MSLEWAQTVIFFLTPFFIMLLLSDDEDDDNGPDSGIMTPVYNPS